MRRALRRVLQFAVLSIFLAPPAFAQDPPLMDTAPKTVPQLTAPEDRPVALHIIGGLVYDDQQQPVAFPSGLVLNDAAVVRLRDAFDGMQGAINTLAAEKKQLEISVQTADAVPRLTGLAIVALLVAGIAAGAAGAFVGMHAFR